MTTENIVFPKSRWKRILELTLKIFVFIGFLVAICLTTNNRKFSKKSDSPIIIFTTSDESSHLGWNPTEEADDHIMVNTMNNLTSELRKSYNDGTRQVLSVGKCRDLCDTIVQHSLNGDFYSTAECDPKCDNLIKTPHAPFNAHVTSIAAKMKQMKVREVFVLGDFNDTPDNVLNILRGFDISIEDYIDTSNSFHDFRSVFHKELQHSSTSVFITNIRALSMFLTAFMLYGGYEKRTFFAHLNSEDREELLGWDREKLVAERLGLLVSLYKTYHKPKSFQEELDAINKPRNSFEIHIERLISSALLRSSVFQSYPWLVETSITVSKENATQWEIIDYHDLPSMVLMKHYLLSFVTTNCEPRIEVTGYEPHSNIKRIRRFTFETFPMGIVIPNSHYKGFGVKITCNGHHKLDITELQCTGGKRLNDSIDCLIARGSTHRRVVRSFTAQHQLNMDNQLVRRTSDMAKEELRNLLPQIAGCVGATTGCAFCFVFLIQLPVNVSPGVCYGACAVAVGGSCSTLIARGVQKKLEDTIICSELFRQRRIGLRSYIADANFGLKLSQTNPLALVGYNFLARPLVEQMKASTTVTDLVHVVATPWIQHMEYSENIRDVDNAVGLIISYSGIFVCSTVGFMMIHSESIKIGISFLAFIYFNKFVSIQR